MRIVKHILFTLLLSASLGQSLAQTVALKDSIFGSFICEFWPQSIVATCDSIKVPQANIQAMLDGSMNFSTRGITNFDGAVHFNNLYLITAFQNKVSIVPQLGVNVFSLDLSDNLVTTFSEEFLTMNTGLKKLKLRNNKLQELPDLSAFTTLDYLDLRGNQLTFEDLEALTSLAKFDVDSFLLDEQEELLFSETTINLQEGDDKTLTLDIDKNAANNLYTWFRNGDLLKTTTQGKLVLTNVSLQDAGEYTVEISNTSPGLERVKLSFANTIEITVVPDVLLIDKEVTTDCEKHLVHVVDNGFPDASRLELFSPQDELYTTVNNSFEITTSGVYGMRFYLGDSLTQQVDQWVTLPALPSCTSAIISPNGDGVDDEFYFEKEGAITIIDHGGKEIIKLQGPTKWNATNANGNTLSPGLYFLQFEDGSVQSISILY